jgi:hypothetical protein
MLIFANTAFIISLTACIDGMLPGHTPRLVFLVVSSWMLGLVALLFLNEPPIQYGALALLIATFGWWIRIACRRRTR